MIGRRGAIAGGLILAAIGPAVAKVEKRTMYGLIGNMTAKPGKRADLLAILLDGVEAMPGCLSYVVAEDPADENGLWITEVWDSETDHKASLQIPSVKAAIAQAMPIIAGFGAHTQTRVVGGIGLAKG